MGVQGCTESTGQVAGYTVLGFRNSAGAVEAKVFRSHSSEVGLGSFARKQARFRRTK